MTQTIEIERDYAVPLDRLWRALTTPHLIAEWLMPNDFQPKTGHAFQFRMEPSAWWNGVTDAEVLDCTPMTRLSYTWNSSGDEAANGLKTVVTFTLTPLPQGVRLRLEHAGFREDQARNFQGARMGWDRNLGTLATVAERD
jgi:uncharacterized protein YndB with AHSA1/START domain